ncbi:MAG: acyl-CoA dehydrogenase [Betaproteobacteria bacterium]|nr:acyl-CoA dehydrogenase [Betaproteobacteria bacterium]NBY05446.1 acyl-CoA dehydrogenase [Betaproteobacteria bacterium]
MGLTWDWDDGDGEELAALRATVRRFIDKEIAPHHARWEREGQVSREVWRKAGELGLLCMGLPAELGGSEVDFAHSAVLVQELARSGFSGPLFYLHSEIVAPYVLHYGTPAQQQAWLPRMASGEVIAAIAMTEPGTGSDLANISTRATTHNGGYLLKGQKIFISNGQLANLVLVAAKTQPELGARGVSLFLLDTSRDGFSRGRNLEKMGMHAQDTSELFFDDVWLPADCLLGQEGKGFAYLMNELPQERLLVAITAVGAMESGLRWTCEHVKERQAFGAPLAEKQVVRHALAQAYADIQVARSFLKDCLQRHLHGQLDTATASVAKFWTTEMQFSVLDRCVQLFGGYGYMNEYPIARAWADARVQRIYGGTTEIMKEIVARHLLDGPSQRIPTSA